jgi:hypothetical protein
MRIAIFKTFAASRKEPLAETIERVHAAFIAAGFGPRVPTDGPRGHASLCLPYKNYQSAVSAGPGWPNQWV